MRKSLFTDAQALGNLRWAVVGQSVTQMGRDQGITQLQL